jgi:hypothetical protein
VPRARPLRTSPDEVLFLTSQDRIVDAFHRWYARSRPGDPNNYSDSVEQARSLLRYLVVPTDIEVARYRRSLSDDS